MKIIKYFCEAIVVYLFFIISKLIGLKLSRSLFSSIFKFVGPIVRSNNLINKNLSRFSNSISEKEKTCPDFQAPTYGLHRNASSEVEFSSWSFIF